MVDLADEFRVGWVLSDIVDQHILEKNKEAQENAEDSDNESSNSGSGKTAASPGEPCSQGSRSTKDDLDWWVKPAYNPGNTQQKAGQGESIRGGALGSGILFHVKFLRKYR